MKTFQVWALLSALFAGITAILAKKCVETVPTNLAVALRVLVVLAFAGAIAVATGQTRVGDVTPRAWTFLVLSGIATGLSWLCIAAHSTSSNKLQKVC
ncbi:MAG TPA: EamA family transporter [Fimbriimonadaceae bacterium]|nr:EamA family transporter [Fimbriimonadaceae bacterium]